MAKNTTANNSVKKYFGQFLLEKNAVSKNELLAALNKQQQDSVLLGDLAIKFDLLTEKQVEAILSEQEHGHLPFGETAVAMGLLKRAHVQELLLEQRRQRPHIGELLVKLGIFEQELLTLYLDDYQQADSHEVFELNGQQHESPEITQAVALLSKIFPTLYLRVSKRPIVLEKVNLADNSPIYEPCWHQQLSGTQDYAIDLILPQAHACYLAGTLLALPGVGWGTGVVDAVGQFLDLVAGHFCHRMEEGVNKLTLGTVNYRANYSANSDRNVPGHTRIMCFDSGHYTCQLVISVR